LWPDHDRLSDLEAQFVCKACGKRGVDFPPDFGRPPVAATGLVSWSTRFDDPIKLPDGVSLMAAHVPAPGRTTTNGCPSCDAGLLRLDKPFNGGISRW
jgi:hypothetical protein